MNVHYLSHHRMLLLLMLVVLAQPVLEQRAFSDIKLPQTTEVLAPVQLHEDPVEESSIDTSAISPISTSRPSFTDAWTTVPRGSFQAENGATYTNNRGGTRAWTLPESLLRLGVTDNTELRFTVPNYLSLRDTQSGSLINNFGDISVGLSHHLKLPAKMELAVIPILNIPTGANNASSNSVDPQLRLSAARVMTPKLTLASMLDTRWNTSRNAATDVIFNTTGIAYYAFTPKLCGFLEYSGFYPTSGPATQFAQSGLLFLISPRQQVDFRVAAGLNRNSPDLLVGFGYSFRVDGLFSGKRKRHARSTSR